MIKAEACWALKKIEGLIQREWLNCLHISSNSGVMWNDVCDFLTSREILSTAIFSGKADDELILSDREMRCIMGKFKHPKNTRVNTNTKWQSIIILDPIIQDESQNEPQIMKTVSFKEY